MKIIKKEGNSEYEVVTSFKKEYGLSDDQFTYEIEQKGSNGFFNIFGNKPTIINFKIEEVNPQIKEMLISLLKKLNAGYKTIEEKQTADEIQLHIIGAEDAGFLIGKEGRFVNSMQHLLNRMKSKDVNKMIKLDVDGYNARKANAIVRKVKGACAKVTRTQKSVTLEPMNPAQRKIVHRFIEKDDKFRTITVGNGYMKRVVVLPVLENEE